VRLGGLVGGDHRRKRGFDQPEVWTSLCPRALSVLVRCAALGRAEWCDLGAFQTTALLAVKVAAGSGAPRVT
jgi:hypothetical protein